LIFIDEDRRMTLLAERIELDSAIADLESAEDFMDYFNVAFDPAIVHVNRLHILQRFHDYLEKSADSGAPDYDTYRALLTKAYEDFVHSNAITERVFKVLKRATGITTIPLSAIGRARR
jgi:nitrogenase-stabilizing/protective protein